MNATGCVGATRERIAQLLKSLDEGLLTKHEMPAHVGLALADAGSVADFASLPSWLQQELIAWGREFRRSQTWLLVSNAGERDVSAAGKRLLALLENAGLLS